MKQDFYHLLFGDEGDCPGDRKGKDARRVPPRIHQPIECPCHGCESRKVGCHDECEGYRAFRKELDALNEMERRERRK